jgi:hypothetical protein
VKQYVFERPDVVSIASVRGVKDEQTLSRLFTLAGFLSAKLLKHDGEVCAIESAGIFVRISWIMISSVGCEKLKAPWQDDEWFADDHCAGPGQALYVHADGRVAVCCGYANEHKRLMIGNIKIDTLSQMLARAEKNLFIQMVYGKGLGALRISLEKQGVVFPGKTLDQCYFCHYLLAKNML